MTTKTKKKIFSLLIFCLLLSSCQKEAALPNGKTIGTGHITESSEIPVYKNFDGTAYCNRIAVSKAEENYHEYECGTTFGEGYYHLRLRKNFGVGVLTTDHGTTNNIFHTDLFLFLKPGDTLKTSGFLLFPLKFERQKGDRLTKGIYEVNSEKEDALKPGEYKFFANKNGKFLLCPAPYHDLSSDTMQYITETRLNLQDGNIVMVEGDGYFTPIDLRLKDNRIQGAEPAKKEDITIPITEKTESKDIRDKLSDFEEEMKLHEKKEQEKASSIRGD